jgi:DNA-binding NarL/FixJ family response regulator
MGSENAAAVLGERKIRVIAADDHALILRGIAAALEGDGGFELVAVASDGVEVMPLVEAHRPDVVLLDVRMPRMDGLASLELLRKKYPEIKVVMISVGSDEEQIDAALTRGAAAYIVKSINPADIPAALRQAVEQTLYNVLVATTSRTTDTKLTDREVAILRAVALGHSNKKIAQSLWVTEQTIKFHLTNIYKKLGVTNRTGAARYAYKAGIAESPILDDQPR